MLHCMGCHLADGSGTPGKVPPLAGHIGFFLQVPGGREFLLRVPGASQSLLSDAELAGVMNEIIARFGAPQVPADFMPYTEAEVARWRHQPIPDVRAERRRLLDQVKKPGVLLEY